MSYARMKTLYVSLSNRYNYESEAKYNAKVEEVISNMNDINSVLTLTHPADDLTPASIKEVYEQPVVEKSSDWMLAVERLEISLNAVPFYDITDGKNVAGYHDIVVVSKDDDSKTQTRSISRSCYSLLDLLDELNDIEWVRPDDGFTVFEANFAFNKDGYITIFLNGASFDEIYFKFPRRLNMILGISIEQQKIGEVTCSSLYPRVDCGDDLDHLILRSSLPCYSDRIGNAKLEVLTDLSSPTSYSNNLQYNAVTGTLVNSGISTNMRQKLIYTPTEKRMLNLTGDFAINFINIDALYVNPDGDIKKILLPLGGIFEIKLGLYLRQ